MMYKGIVKADHFPRTTKTHFFRYLSTKGAIATLETMSWRLTAPGHLNDPEDIFFRKFLPYSVDEMLHVSTESFARSVCAGKVPPLMKKVLGLPDSLALGNSPLTFDEWMTEILGNEEYVKSQKEHFEKVNRSTNEELREQFADHFLLCLTDDPVNPEMWKRYAQQGQGAAFRIECLPKIDNVFLMAQQVKYSDSPPPFGTREEWLDFLEGGEGIEVERLYKEIVTWKRTSWAYEKEWRVILIEKKDHGLPHTTIALNREELSEIYLGPEMTSEHLLQIMQLVEAAYPFTRIIDLKQLK